MTAVVSPTSSQALVVGISDQTPESLGDSRLTALPLAHARLVVPWDAAFTIPASVDAWLAAAGAGGLTPLVAFERGAGQTCPSQCSVPSASEYADAFRAFRARWPVVREFTPWNEPNHPAQPTAHDPAIAAGYHDVLRVLCPSCTIVAGDFVDSTNMKSYFRSYAAALRAPAAVWGIHNYGDVTYDRPSYLEWLAAQVATPVWMTETGGIVRLGSGADQSLPEDADRAAAAIGRVFALAAAQPERVTRVYLYQWRARATDDFDAGLVAPDGSPRPGLARFRAQLGLAVAPGLPDGPASLDATAPSALGSAGARGGAATEGLAAGTTTSTSATRTVTYGSAPPLSVSRPVRVRGGVRLGVTCPRARSAGCQGAVTVMLQARSAPRSVRLGRVTVRMRAGQHRALRMAVGRTARRRWNRAPAWELHTVSVIRAPTGVQDRIWMPRRPEAPRVSTGDER